MASRTVISLAMDLIGSTANGLKMSDNQFRRFNRALIDQIEAYIENFGLESAVLKFTGDGFFLSHPDLEMARTIVAFAKTISFRFQKDLADTLGIGEASVPAIRVAICTGDDQSIEMRDGQLEWVGDSARRAARACQQCWPNELIVSSTIYEKILRVFITRPIEITERNMQSKWEEPFTIYSVGEIRADYAEELRNDVDPAAPFIKYLDLTDRTPAASELASRAIETYEEESQSLGRAASPSEIIRLREREAQLRQLLYVAPDAKVRSQVVERMTTLGIPPTVPVYNKLIRNASKYDDALEWFHLMIRQGVRPDSITHTTLINLSPDIETATRWFDAMRKAGLQPDEVAYNSLIKRSPDLDTATRWFDAMQHAGVRPNRVTYGTLIARSPDMTTATRWFEAMGHAGIQPDTVTFNTLIKLSPDIASATQWFHAMGHADAAPNHVTFGTLINLSPDIETATKWYEAMGDAKVQADSVIYNTLINRSPDLHTATRWFEAMGCAGLHANLVTYTTLIQRSPDIATATRWFEGMVHSGIKPSIVTYSALINLSPDIETATRWFDAMRKAGLQPDEVAYNSLIKRSPDLDTATRWFDAMQHAGVRPNRVTYCTLIARSPDMTSATRWFEAMGHAGIQPDTVTFNTLIKLSPDIASATQWFDAMGHAAVKPDVITYGTLINLSPDLATSEQWFDCMRKAGIKPNKEVMSSLPKHLSNPADADRLTTRLLSLGIFIKESYYTTLYKRIAHKLSAGDLLRWHSKQPNAYPAALFVAITVYVKEARIDDACRIALVVPYSATARKLFREHYSIAATYYRRFLQNGFDPYNTHYALAYCYFENGQLPEALTMFEKALQSSTNAKRSADITRCIEVIRSR